MADDDPQGTKTNVESSGKYDTTACDYFKDKRFFADEEDARNFMQTVKEYKENKNKPLVFHLEALNVHEFYTKALEICENDDKRETFFVKNIKDCNEQLVLDDYHQWRKDTGLEKSDPPRMVSVGYKIQGTQLSHTFDLECFTERIEELFTWWDKEDNDIIKFAGPYMCFVQSSGMGKTKLMYEYRRKNEPPKEQQKDAPPLVKKNKKRKKTTNEKQDDTRVVAQLILPTDIDLGTKEELKELFDHQLALDKEIPETPSAATAAAAEQATTIVHEKLDAITKKLRLCKKIVLLFDESHVLLEKNFNFEAFLFRCIRTWLRERRPNGQRVVAVFAGTNSRLSNFLVESDRKLQRSTPPSRVHQLADRIYSGIGILSNPPFYQTTTIGACLALMPKDLGLSEYARSVYYGRPLFAVMASANENILDEHLAMVLSRMLLSNKDGKNWEDNRSAIINLLSTRVQMGQTTMAVTSDLVAKAYANLSGYFEETKAAQLAYLPDPVCARLAMCMMDENFTCQLPHTNNCVKGKCKQWWTGKLTEIVSSGILSPENGDVGVVVVALYMLFCADLLRREKCIEQLKGMVKEKNYMIQHAYKQFSVSLDEFLLSLKSGGKEPLATMETGKACQISVGFIQVCRNSLQSYCTSWETLADKDFLKYVYESGTAFYVCPECPLQDLVIPLRIETATKPEFIPMLVSMQCHSTFSTQSAVDECKKMKERAMTDKLTKAFCLLVVFGWESIPQSATINEKDFDELTDIKGVSERLTNNTDVVVKAIFVPKDDNFKLSDAFKCMIPTAQVRGELFVAHPFIKAHGAEELEGLVNPSKAMRSSSKYFSDLYTRLRHAMISKPKQGQDWRKSERLT